MQWLRWSSVIFTRAISPNGSFLWVTSIAGRGGRLTAGTKLWTFHYAAGFRGPGILIKRSTIVDLSVRRLEVQISQNIQKRLKKYPKIDCRAFAFSRRCVRHSKFWTSLGCQNSRGAMPPLPPPPGGMAPGPWIQKTIRVFQEYMK